jgi:hypothetical protein
VSALSTAVIAVTLLAQQQEENDRVGPVQGGNTAIAPLMRDGLGSVFALSSLTGGVGQGAILGGATGGGLDLYGAGTAGGLGGFNGMMGGAGPGGLATMGGGSMGMPSALGQGMASAKGGLRGGAGFRSPTRMGLMPKAGRAGLGKGKAAGSKFDLLGAKPAAAALDPLLKGLLASGPLAPDEAKLIVHAMVSAEASGSSDPAARATLLDAARKFLVPNAGAESAALQAKIDELVPAAPDATSRPIDADLVRAWFGALDVSNDGAISFLEWRDRTGLGLDAFRAFDTSGEGLIQFDELQRALVLNAAAGGREVDPALLETARAEVNGAAAPTAAGSEAKAAKAEQPAPKIPLDELLAQVRSLLAKVSAQQAALAASSGGADAKAKGAASATKSGTNAKKPPSPFDLLGTAPGSAQKKTPPKKPASAPVSPSSGNH